RHFKQPVRFSVSLIPGSASALRLGQPSPKAGPLVWQKGRREAQARCAASHYRRGILNDTRRGGLTRTLVRAGWSAIRRCPALLRPRRLRPPLRATWHSVQEMLLV